MFAMIEDQQKSGLTQRAYVERHGVHLWKFQYWLRKYRKMNSRSAGFIPLEVDGAKASTIDIQYPNGVQLSIPSQT
ncbi:MAG: hypothetical protein ABEH43_08970, partial [Flavobacteriales bacterium]